MTAPYMGFLSPFQRKVRQGALQDPGMTPEGPDPNQWSMLRHVPEAVIGSMNGPALSENQPTPRPGLGSRIRGALGVYGGPVAGGLMATMDPSGESGGLQSFLGNLGRGFAGTTQARQGIADQRQAGQEHTEDRTLRNDELRARIAAMTAKDTPRPTVLAEGGQLIGPDGRVIATNARPVAPERPPVIPESYQEMVGPQGAGVYRIPRGGAPERVGGVIPKPDASATGGKPLPAAAVDKIMTNRQNLRTIDEALAGVASNPNAFGLRNAMPFGINDRLDPTGVAARSPVADVSSMVIHDRSGAAVTVSEMPRLRPFIPVPSDPAEVVQRKLAALRQRISDITGDLEGYYGEIGYAVPSALPGGASGLVGSQRAPAGIAPPGRSSPASGAGVSTSERRQLREQGYTDEEIDAL